MEEPKLRIAPEGYTIIAYGVILCLLGWLTFWFFPIITNIPPIAISVLVCGVIFFFRDPGRIPVEGDDKILAPADGTVLPFGIYTDQNGNEYRMVSVFLSLLNVHVNRSSVSGIVENIDYFPGKCNLAFSRKAGESNEKNRITIKTERGTIIFQQVTGFIARRIVCNLKAGQNVTAGQRIGIMKFGSRMDLIIPENVDIIVKPRDKVKAGITVMAVWKNAKI